MKNFKNKCAHVITVIGVFVCAVFISACLTGTAEAAQLTTAKPTLPPNATKVVKNKDGNYYALYKGKVCSLTKIKNHAKIIVVPKYIKVNGKRYKVVTIHELGLLKRKDVKKVIIYADNMETIEDPALYKHYRKQYHKKLTVVVKDKATRKWLNK